MKAKRTIAALAAALLLFICLLPAAAEEQSCTATFTEGLTLINPLTGKKAIQIFTGEDVAPITVKYGGSFVFPENTIVFRDYVFIGWKYTYTDDEGKTAAKMYYPGDTYSGLTEDMTFGAAWKRPEPIDLVITGYINYVNLESYSDGELPEPYQVVYKSEITLKRVTLTKDGYVFAGWTDSDGMFYQNGGEYTVNKLNPVLTAVWEKDGEAELRHRVEYAAGADGCEGTPPKTFEMYSKTTFTAAECELKRSGWKFVCWKDDSGAEYTPGKEYQVSDEKLVLTAVWEEVKNYWIVSVVCGEGGSVSPAEALKLPEGDGTTVAAVPDDGYYVKSITLNGSPVEVFELYQVTDISEDMAFVVTFERKASYTVTAETTTGGSVSVSGGPQFTEGSRVAFTVIPDDGYELSSINVTGGQYAAAGDGYAIESIADNVTITAVFTPVNEPSSRVSSASDASGGQSGDPADIYLIILGIVMIALIVFAVIFYKRR